MNPTERKTGRITRATFIASKPVAVGTFVELDGRTFHELERIRRIVEEPAPAGAEVVSFPALEHQNFYVPVLSKGKEKPDGSPLGQRPRNWISR